ncbi:MAG: sugar phosphate isomerase/epimerase, partial [Anaerolineae bacterium]|nr:sugar phosphate isomerase/epimerase [Anaerolineae bacterium]
MRLGLSTYAYAWAIGIPGYPPAQPMDAPVFIQRAADLGVGVVQIADNLPLHRLAAAEQDHLSAQAQSLGLQVEVGTRGIAPDHLRTYLELAQRFESPILRVVVDTADHHPSPEEVVALLRPLMPDFERAGITLAIENHDRFKVRALVGIFAALVGAPVGICLDTVNSFGAGEGPEVVVETLGPYVVNLHIKDFTIRRHRHMLGFEVEGTPAGQGMLNVPWMMEQLHGMGRDCNAILETWPPPEPELIRTIEKED